MARTLIVLFALLMVPVGTKAKRDPHSARFGDLVITVSAMESTEAEKHSGDTHSVAVFLSVKNAGNSAVCMEFRTTLKATYGLTYSGYSYGGFNRFPPAPKIREMLPGEESSGSYFFVVKDGVQPLEITLIPASKTLQCRSSEPSWKEALLPQELRFDVRDLLTGNEVRTEAKQTDEAPPAALHLALPALSEAQIAQNMGMVVLYRVRSFYDSSGRASVFCDGTRVARVGVNRYVAVALPAGEHICTAQRLDRKGTSVSIQQGSRMFMRVITGFKGQRLEESPNGEQEARLLQPEAAQ